jgi:hypothetical protein
MSDTEGCRVPGCSNAEWMMRQLCKEHFTMLPHEVQLEIREAVKSAGFRRREWLKPMFVKALDLIATVENHNRNAAIVTFYRQRMAAVNGLVATIRQLPFKELFEQLETSAGLLLTDFPETYEERKIGINRDLAFLSFFVDARERLGEIIRAYPQPETPAPELVGENSQADGAAPAEIVE